MKRVEWYIAKVYKDRTIDLWERFPNEAKARKYIRDDGPDSPFEVTKVTTETFKVPPKMASKKPSKRK